VRIAAVRALPGLGDLLCAVPALRALRAAHPGAHVALIGLESVWPLVERLGAYVDELLPFPGWPGIPEVPYDAARTEAFLAEHRGRFDLALQLHGSGAASASFVEALGAARSAGFAPSPRGEGWLPPADDLHEVRRWLRLLAHLGIPARGEHLELPLTAGDEREAAALRPAGPYACLHPGASRPQRRWPAERFAQVADWLADRGVTPVLTGTASERDVAGAVRAHMRAEPLDALGRTSLGGLGALLAGASTVVTNDTGTSHLAAAVGAPSVVVLVSSDGARWAPLDRSLHRVLPEPSGPPRPGDPDLDLPPVPVGAVLRELEALLELRQLDARAAVHDDV
jgi:ADP-heptose:LPS heptosyltransferase